MKNFINAVTFIVLTIIRIFVFYKMTCLLYFGYTQPHNFKISEMGWFAGFMLLDMWILIVVKYTLPSKIEVEGDE